MRGSLASTERMCNGFGNGASCAYNSSPVGKSEESGAVKRHLRKYIGFDTTTRCKTFAGRRQFISTKQGLSITEGGTSELGQVDHIAFEVQDVVALNDKLK